MLKQKHARIDRCRLAAISIGRTGAQREPGIRIVMQSKDKRGYQFWQGLTLEQVAQFRDQMQRILDEAKT